MNHTHDPSDEPSVHRSRRAATTALDVAVDLWGLATIGGLGVFGAYIAALYVWGLAKGDLDRWNAVLPTGHGYVVGDQAGNTALGVHVLAAVVVAACGAIQLVPAVRQGAPGLHRWSGRIFLGLGMAAAASGVLIAVTRGPVAGPYMAIGNILDAVLVLLFGGLAWRAARRRDFSAHQRWALRAFIVIFGVWFYRLLMMLWFAANGGPAGHTEAFDGPWDIFLAFAHFLLPLAVLELYLRARSGGSALAMWAMAAVMTVAALGTAAGTVLATVGMWWPRL